MRLDYSCRVLSRGPHSNLELWWDPLESKLLPHTCDILWCLCPICRAILRWSPTTSGPERCWEQRASTVILFWHHRVAHVISSSGNTFPHHHNLSITFPHFKTSFFRNGFLDHTLIVGMMVNLSNKFLLNTYWVLQIGSSSFREQKYNALFLPALKQLTVYWGWFSKKLTVTWHHSEATYRLSKQWLPQSEWSLSSNPITPSAHIYNYSPKRKLITFYPEISF